MNELKNREHDVLAVCDTLGEDAFYRFRWYDVLDSTNTHMRQYVDEPEGLVIVADRQTAGIGRVGRRFYSPGNSGLYFSVLLKPDRFRTDPTMITAMAAVAVCRGMESLMPCEPKIKWVNDIYQNNKKICGILAQGASNGDGLSYMILGIGINVYEPQGGFEKEIQSIAGAWVKEEQEGLRQSLLGAILRELREMYCHYDRKTLVKEYRERSFIIGKRVTVYQAQSEQSATVLAIDEACNLKVRYEQDGREETLMAGEVRLAVQ